jgi:hypothetical protein
VRGHAGDAYEVGRGRRLARRRLGGGAGVRRRTGGGRHGGKAGIGFEEETTDGSAPVFFFLIDDHLGKVTCGFFFSVVMLWTKIGMGPFATRKRTLTR